MNFRSVSIPLFACIALLAVGSAFGQTTTAPPPSTGASYFIGVGGEVNRYASTPFSAVTVDFGVCGNSLCSISTVENQKSLATIRTGVGYYLLKTGPVSLYALADAGISTGTVATTPNPASVTLANVGGGFKVRYDLGSHFKTLQGLGLTGGVRIAGVTTQGIAPEYMVSVSYRLK